MRTVRVVAASSLVLVGAILVAVGSLSGAAVRVVNDGAAAGTITQRLLASPEVAQVAADRIQAALKAQVSGTGPASLLQMFDRQIHQAIVGILRSDLVGGVVTSSVRHVSDQLVAALTDPSRPPGPFVVSADLSDRVNASLHAVPVVGPLIPQVTVPPVTVTVIDAAAFTEVRAAYRAAVLAERWFFWLGLVLILAGWRAAPKGRRYWTYATAGTAGVGLAVAVTVSALSPQALATVVPGGATGGAGTFVSTFVSRGEIARLADGLFLTGAVAVALAGLFALATRPAPQTWGEAAWARVRASLPSPRAAAPAPERGSTAVAARTVDADPDDEEIPATLAPSTEPDAAVVAAREERGATPGVEARAGGARVDAADGEPRETSSTHFLPEPAEVVEVEEWPAPRPADPARPEPWAQVSSREPVAMRTSAPERDRAFDLDGPEVPAPPHELGADWEGLAAFAEIEKMSSGEGEGSEPLSSLAAAKESAKTTAATSAMDANPPSVKKPPARSPAKKPTAKKPAPKKPPAVDAPAALRSPAKKPASKKPAPKKPTPPPAG